MIRRAEENVGSVEVLGVGFVCTWKFNLSLLHQKFRVRDWVRDSESGSGFIFAISHA